MSGSIASCQRSRDSTWSVCSSFQAGTDRSYMLGKIRICASSKSLTGPQPYPRSPAGARQSWPHGCARGLTQHGLATSTSHQAALQAGPSPGTPSTSTVITAAVLQHSRPKLQPAAATSTLMPTSTKWASFGSRSASPVTWQVTASTALKRTGLYCTMPQAGILC